MDYTHNWLKRNPENFPAALWLLPESAHAPLIALYAFLDGAGEIANSNKRLLERRQAVLSLEEAFVAGKVKALPPWAKDFFRLAQAQHALMSSARDLLSAFVQDTARSRYRDFSELLDYCQRSAAPIGRMIVHMCGEPGVDAAACDALCNALEMLGHIQNCSDDYVNLGRIYLPLDWFAFAGADVRELAASESSAKLRLVLDHALDNCDRLLTVAAKLPASIKNRKVRVKAVWVHLLAQRLAALLRTRDPLAGPVRLSKSTVLWCLARAWARAWARP